MKRIIVPVALAAVAAVALAGCSSPTGEAPAPSNATLALAPVADVMTFAPQGAGDGQAVQWMQPVYDTLIRQAPDGSFVGMLATEWEYDDARTALTLQLADGVAFDDGTPLDAEAVRVNLEATRDGTGPLSTQLSSITAIDVVDADTVVLRLAAPDPSLVRGLSQPSGAIANPLSVGSESLLTVPDGTGPYVLDEDATVRGSSYVFTRRDDYWDDSLDVPYSRIVYTPMVDITARLNALQSGQVDGAYVDTKSIAQLEGAGLTVTTYPAAGVVGLFLLDRDGAIQPALADVRVRQAINLALDNSALLRQLRSDLGTVSEQIFNPQSDAWDGGLNETYGVDVERAKALMVEAGYADGFTIDIPEVAMFPEGTIVAQALADIGITVNWAKVAPTELLSEMRSGSYPVILMQLQSTDPWQAIQFFVAPDAAWNVLSSRSADLDELIGAAQMASGSDQVEAYREINTYLVDNAWFAPFYFPDNVYATGGDTTVVAQYQQGVPSIYNYAPATK